MSCIKPACVMFKQNTTRLLQSVYGQTTLCTKHESRNIIKVEESKENLKIHKIEKKKRKKEKKDQKEKN